MKSTYIKYCSYSLTFNFLIQGARLIDENNTKDRRIGIVIKNQSENMYLGRNGTFLRERRSSGMITFFMHHTNQILTD
jgi:hypothetical protein